MPHNLIGAGDLFEGLLTHLRISLILLYGVFDRGRSGSVGKSTLLEGERGGADRLEGLQVDEGAEAATLSLRQLKVLILCIAVMLSRLSIHVGSIRGTVAQIFGGRRPLAKNSEGLLALDGREPR